MKYYIVQLIIIEFNKILLSSERDSIILGGVQIYVDHYVDTNYKQCQMHSATNHQWFKFRIKI